MQQRIDALPPQLRHRRIFADTYRRTTAGRRRGHRGRPVRGPGVGRHLGRRLRRPVPDAHDADRDGRTDDVPRPWRLAFDAPADLPPLRHVLLGINAHVNYDLPQAMLAVISDADFTDPVLIGRRRRDHERIDAVLASRVAAEDDALGAREPCLDRVLQPLNRLGSKRFLREARQKVWLNVEQLQAAQTGRARCLPAPAGRAGGAQRGEDRRPARPGAGGAAAGRRRVRSACFRLRERRSAPRSAATRSAAAAVDHGPIRSPATRATAPRRVA